MEIDDSLSDFHALVLPHLDAAHNLARWLLGDATTAEDVVQDGMVRAWKYFSTCRRENPRAWLLQIVRNGAYASINAQRRRGHVSLTPLDSAADDDQGADVQPPDPRPDPEEMLIHKQDVAALDAALAALPVALCECLILREIEGLSYKEIAQVTSVPIGTVMSRLCRARETLRHDRPGTSASVAGHDSGYGEASELARR